MFKKIEIWILYLVILLGILGTIFFGVLVRQELVGTIKAGWVSKTALTITQTTIDLIKYLRKFDFVTVDRFPELDEFNGTPNNIESYLLLSIIDGDINEGVVKLIDLTNFEVLHVWNPDINAFNDMVDQVEEFKYLDRDNNDSRVVIGHPKLAKDGGLIFQTDGPLRKIDACSKLIFQNSHDKFHHSLETDDDGNIWVPSRIYPQSLPIEKVGRNIREESGFDDDAIAKLSENGEILYEKSVSQIFIENGLEYLLFSVNGSSSFITDPIHLNDIQPVNFDSNYWRKGDVFLSLRSQSMVILYRPSTNKIIWKGTGPFFHQHDVDILDEHRISIFNNNSKDFVDGEYVDGNNEVIIYNFKTDKYSLHLNDALAENEVRTVTQGRSEILSNGDLFVEESNYARTLYFNSDGSLRWTHVNRADNGNLYVLGWSRILYTDDDIKIVKKFIENRGTCSE
tara:strand:+ start:833 stop:2194 length:1362 start_codon:yes stop_codon:yes gene_type:complete